MKTLIFEVQLLGHGNVSRTIEIPEAYSLYRLAEGVIGAFGFNFDHAFGFFDSDQGIGHIFAAQNNMLDRLAFPNPLKVCFNIRNTWSRLSVGR